MKLFKKLKYLRLARHIIKEGKTQELKDLPKPVAAEDMDEATRQNMIDNWNKHVERSNRQADKLESDVNKAMKKKSKLFDLALITAVKSNKKFLYVINHTQPGFKFDFKFTNHSRGITGYTRIKLKPVRKEMTKKGINYRELSKGAVYEEMTRIKKG